MPKQPTRKETEPRRAGVESGDEAIAKLAYQLWLQRGQPDGSSEEDWYRAQDLLRSEEAVNAPSSAR
jgi:hypothetical protein